MVFCKENHKKVLSAKSRKVYHLNQYFLCTIDEMVCIQKRMQVVAVGIIYMPINAISLQIGCKRE